MREVIPAPVSGLDLRREYGHHQSPAIRAGGLMFCSGMVAIDPQSGERQHGTVTSEARRIFENLNLLLESTDAPSFRHTPRWHPAGASCRSRSRSITVASSKLRATACSFTAQ